MMAKTTFSNGHNHKSGVRQGRDVGERELREGVKLQGKYTVRRPVTCSPLPYDNLLITCLEEEWILTSIVKKLMVN